ncbi:hypothetical protein ETC03_29560, partial [Geobacillus sp. MMMUD3]|nr:hypothetical protein [Geobacillus sp. MMMUD3]
GRGRRSVEVAAGHRLGRACRVVLRCRVADTGEDESVGGGDEHRPLGGDPGIRLGEEFGFTTVTIDEVGRGGRYSSSRIRDQIISGDVAEAADQLGRYHRVEGTVVHGDARGRDLGFPTANLSADGEG